MQNSRLSIFDQKPPTFYTDDCGKAGKPQVNPIIDIHFYLSETLMALKRAAALSLGEKHTDG